MNTEYVQGNIFVRQMLFEDGVVDGHSHNHDHTSYLPRGKVLAELLDDKDKVVKSVVKSADDGFNFLLIKAGVRHRFTRIPTFKLNEALLRTSLSLSGVPTEVIDKAVKVASMEVKPIAHCIYAHHNPQGEVVQEYDGWTPGYV